MHNTPTKIFQYEPEIPEEHKARNKTNYWLEKLFSQGQQAADANKNLDSRISVLELRYKNESTEASNDDKNFETSKLSGVEQHEREKATKNAKDKHTIEGLVKQSNRKIMSISSSFPWSFFPNTIDVEEKRVTFNFHQFMSYQSHSVDIKDITNVFIESGLFYATIQVVSKTYTQNDIKIAYVKKKEAVRIRKIIESLRTFTYNDIDTSNYAVSDLIIELEQLNISNHRK